MATELARRIRGTRSHLGDKLRQRWLEATAVECEPLTLGDLRKGDRFIFMPNPGDNSGHGGLLNGSYIFMKIETDTNSFTPEHILRLLDGSLTHDRSDCMVIKVE